MADNEQELIAQFAGMTGASPEIAQQFLENSSWDLSSAVTEFFNPPEEVNEPTPSASGPSPASRAPQPIPTTSSVPSAPARSSQPTQRKKFATLGDLNSSSGNDGHGHDHGDDDDDALADDPNLYAGGEKSGLAVENPDDIKRKIIERARKNVQRPGGDDARPPRSNFSGTARTLGGDDTPSEVIDDPSSSQSQGPRERVTRVLHFWSDGFSVDDGPLYRLDDPRNAEILAHIKQGRAPMHLLNVSQDQEVDVQLEQHSEKYVQPQKKYKPFEGSGQRLGSPTAAGFVANASSGTTAIPTSAATASSNTTQHQQQQQQVTLDESAPTLSLQIRLADGSRLSSRFNTTHTVGDVYEFISVSSPAAAQRAWVLMTTFPSKDLTDKGLVLGDIPGFERGGVVVQKWT